MTAESGNQRSHRFSLALSTIALVLSGVVAYRGLFKPFSLRMWINPVIAVQHKKNLSLQMTISFNNESPRSGLVTSLVGIINRTENPEDKFLLIFSGFRTPPEMVTTLGMDSTILVNRPSKKLLPVSLAPGAWASYVASFVYAANDEFPISTGTYVCEVLVWTNYEERARYRNTVKFVVNADVLTKYMDRRKRGSTWLEPIPTVGTIPLTSKKLSRAEYEELAR